MKVFKYILESRVNKISLPLGSKLLKVDMQNGSRTLWAMVNDAEEVHDFHAIEIYGTGHEIEGHENLDFIDTFFDGPFVWHCFERKTEEV